MNRILVVDDDPFILESILDLFQIEGLESVAAQDCATAEELMQNEHFPVILADLRVRTEAEGLGLLEHIRRVSPESAVVTMTGMADEVIENRLRELGARIVLFKPVEADVLISLVREMLAEIEASAALLQNDDIELLHATVTPKLRAIAFRRYGFSGEEADDLVQRAWLLYFEKKAAIRAAQAWMTGTIMNLCKQEIQQRYRQRAYDDHNDATQEVSSDAHDARIAIEQALSVLDDRGRELCTRIGLAGQSYEEVAASMNLPIGSIGPLFIRAKNRMRAHLTMAKAA